jgi:hypothetical protein
MIWRTKNFFLAAQDLLHSIFNRGCNFEFNSLGSTIKHNGCKKRNRIISQTLRLFY